MESMNNNKWCIYTSSYDRGLGHLLDIWPDVVKEVPDAQLHIFYGWELFVKFYSDNPAMMQWKQQMDKKMEYKGITNHNRVGQVEMEEWYKKCGIWAYPTHFGEISCISAMKAQAWGAVPVVIDLAALKETVKYGFKVEGDIYEEEVQELYKENLINALKNPEILNKIRPKMMKWAKEKFTWKNVAKQWDYEFKHDEMREAIETILKANPRAEQYLPIQLQEKYELKRSY